MFFPRSKPLELAPAQVRGLRLSLNTPVVATEELPIGPARAAILLHDEPGRGETVSIGIRSLRADRFAVYGIDPEADGETTYDVAVDAALSFAESMGFLFDEDELGEGGAPSRSRCLGLWRDLLGEGLEKPGPEADELLLDELVEEATEVAVLDAPSEDEAAVDEEIGDFLPPPADTSDRAGSDARAAAEAAKGAVAEAAKRAAADAAGDARRQAVPLSKFRGAPEEAPRAAAAASPVRPGRAALGRLRLVRRVRDGLRRRNPILRLFGAF